MYMWLEHFYWSPFPHPQVHMFSYQCSQLSTPESVIEVFNTAKSFQKKQDTTKFVSIVVLDEVGLAEDSPNLPLKALQSLLEDGTEGGDTSKQVIQNKPALTKKHVTSDVALSVCMCRLLIMRNVLLSLVFLTGHWTQLK